MDGCVVGDEAAINGNKLPHHNRCSRHHSSSIFINLTMERRNGDHIPFTVARVSLIGGLYVTEPCSSLLVYKVLG